MTKAEAQNLAEQLGWSVSSVAEFDDALDRVGYILAMENATGDWVVISEEESENILARCA